MAFSALEAATDEAFANRDPHIFGHFTNRRNFCALQFGVAHGPAKILFKSRQEFLRFRLTFGKGLLN